MRVLITGATGLIGSKISQLCKEKGIDVHYLSTSKDKLENKTDYKGFYWNPNENEIDSRAIDGVDTIINLVGASIAERWTPEQKERILKSRTHTANLLYRCLQENEHHVKNLVSASAIGIYPNSLEKLYTEDEDLGVDDSFVGEVIVKWEEAVDNFKELGIEVAKIRIGLVLAENGGMLKKLMEPLNFNVGSPLGSGNQWQSWIHIDDISGIFMFAVENELTGIYNAVAPNPVTNKELVNEVASLMGKSVWLPNVPKVALKLVLGEMAHIVLSSQLVSSDKIEQEGYIFNYVNLTKALEDLI